MWIESIDLDDFGHFDRARLAGLDGGLNVVAGPQRAGKTTLMGAIRHLGYGLTSGSDVPPATDRYAVTATVVHDGYRYELSLDGYADPAVTPLDRGAPDRTPRELFGGLRKSQYQQLYTVSLDELSRDPATLDDDVDLSTVLLEAAGGDITDVPDVRDALADEAKDVGGKHGRKSYDLREPLETIEAGVEERKRATAQVDEHEQTAAERADVQARIEAIEAEMETVDRERTRLEAVVANHDTYEELRERTRELESMDTGGVEEFPLASLDEARALRDEYESARRDRREAIEAFESAVDATDPASYRRRLLDAGAAIRRFDHERSGWEQRVETLRERRRELDETRRRLRRTAANLGPDWDGGGDDLRTVRTLDTDLFSRDAVTQAVERHRDASEAVAEQSRAIDGLEGRLERFEDRVDAAVESADGASLSDQVPVAALGAVFALAAGSAAAVAGGALAGVVVATLVCLVTGGYVVSRVDVETPAHDGVSVDALRAEAEKVRTELEDRRERLAAREAELSAADETLDELRAAYDLPDDASADAVGRFHDELVDLKEEVAAADADRERFAERADDLRDELDDVVATLVAAGVLESALDDPLDDAPVVFSAVERAVAHLSAAEAVEDATERVAELEADVVAVLERWEETAPAAVGDGALASELDRFVERGEEVRRTVERREERDRTRATLTNRLGVQAYAEALEPLRADGDDGEDDGGEEETETTEDWLVDAYERVLDEHGSVDEVRKRLDELDDEREALAAEKDERLDERAELDRELRDLASDAEVRAAHETIERGRRRLEPLAEAYASRRIAEYLLDELHERFVERTTGPLLDDAGDVFRRITGDAYTGIDSRNEFDDLDFEAVLRDGGVHRTTELSRATAEQLFLAVRLARIERYDEPLPVLLDDSLTNFDPEHVRRTLDVVDELADQTQVFLLTCHPTLVDRVADAYDAQYWGLDDGTFDGSHGSPEAVRSLLDGDERERPASGRP